MPWYIIDTRDRVAQCVTEDAPDALPRFVKVQANNVREAFDAALRCTWQTETGMPWTKTCVRLAAPGSPWCEQHKRDARELYPHLPLPSGKRP